MNLLILSHFGFSLSRVKIEKLKAQKSIQNEQQPAEARQSVKSDHFWSRSKGNFSKVDYNHCNTIGYNLIKPLNCYKVQRSPAPRSPLPIAAIGCDLIGQAFVVCGRFEKVLKPSNRTDRCQQCGRVGRAWLTGVHIAFGRTKLALNIQQSRQAH